MSTLQPDEADRSVVRPIPANRKNDKRLRNQSELSNETLSLGKIIDFQANGDVHIPGTVRQLDSLYISICP